MTPTSGLPIRQLRGIEFLAGLPEADLAPLAATARVVRYAAGVEVISAEPPTDVAYVVIRGTIRLFRRGPDGREVTLSTIGRGQILGLPTLLGLRDPFDFRAEAS